MSVSSPLYTLLKSNFRAWLSAKGFWLVAAAALLPLVLTGAWVGAHRADVAVTSFTVNGGSFDGFTANEGDNLTFVAVVENVGSEYVRSFNFTVAVGEVEAGRLFPTGDETITVEDLAPGDRRELTLNWTARAGVSWALATADPADDVGERDEFNNQLPEPFSVAYKVPDTPPATPLGLEGDTNATNTTDLVIESISRSATGVRVGDNVTFTVTVRNDGDAVTGAQVVNRVVRLAGVRPVAVGTPVTQTLDLAAGETRAIEMTWTAQEGAFFHEGYVLPPADAKDADAEDSYRTEPLVVNVQVTPDMKPPEPEERLTIKNFYLQVLSLLHLTVLLPMIALFYAAGVIADEKERGSLAYVLTRPIPRWLIPVTKFAASFLVATVATLVGLVITYLFLFGTTLDAKDIGYLSTPILVSLLALFVYGGLFILLGTLVEKPYLWGIGFVLGWEFVANLLVPWVHNFTISYHIRKTLLGNDDGPFDVPRFDDGWAFDAGVQWLPGGDVAMRAFLTLLAIGAVALALASAQMRRREFDVG